MKAPVRSPLACEANVSGEGWSPRARVVCEPSGATKMTLERFASILELNRSLTDISGPRRTSRSPGVADNRTACAQAGNGSPSNIVASTMTPRPVRIPNQYMPTMLKMRKLPCLPRQRAAGDGLLVPVFSKRGNTQAVPGFAPGFARVCPRQRAEGDGLLVPMFSKRGNTQAVPGFARVCAGSGLRGLQRLRHQHQRAARKCELPPQFVDHIHLRGVRPGIQLG
jgi:hypothetical protein